MTKEVVRISYEYELQFETREHRNMMIRELKKEPAYRVSGAGIAKDGKAYAYEYKIAGKGNLVKEPTP